jgi:PPK2 family polyphosphate:nucleotide phosphotransferase
MAYAHKIEPGSKVRLKDMAADDRGGLSKEEGEAKSAKLGAELGELQDLLYSAGETALLIVLQGMDTSGKDGTIRCVTQYVNAQSCRVAPFKGPTPNELAHDFLWRVHAETPERGTMTIFNRSHYEDVLVARVHSLVPQEVWKKRYDDINAFEKTLVDSGTVILKFMLHIDKKEQEQRLMDREKDPTKSWKLSVNDWKERQFWDDYTAAFEDALSKCSTPYAPWFVVPANHKWFRNVAIMEQLVEHLRPFRKRWMKDLEERGVQAKKEIEEFRKTERLSH